jgi:predicted DsbA family dithiol-disulfide isomerase
MKKSADPLRLDAPLRSVLHAPLLRALLVLVSLSLLGGCGLLGGGGGEAGEVKSASEASEDAEASKTVLVLEGREVSLAELNDHMKDQFLEELMRQPEEQIFELRENAIRDLVQRHAIDSAAAERGLTAEALYEEVTRSAPEPGAAEIAAWYAANESRLGGRKLEDIAPQIEQMLASEARGQAWRDFVEPRVAALDWEMKIEPPRQDLEATRLVRGDPEAPVTLMTFSDYQCPYCIRSEPVLAEVLSRYPGQVRLNHRHFPLDNIHPQARPAAEAAMCADEQGRFWDYHDAIFARSGRLTESSFAEIAEELALDTEALGTCIEERRYREFVENDFQTGQTAGVTGTPAFFINGIPLKGARDADALGRVIDAELARIASN